MNEVKIILNTKYLKNYYTLSDIQLTQQQQQQKILELTKSSQTAYTLCVYYLTILIGYAKILKFINFIFQISIGQNGWMQLEDESSFKTHKFKKNKNIKLMNHS